MLLQISTHDGIAFGARFSYSDYTEGPSPIVMDEAFALDDALQQAEIIYSVRAPEFDPIVREQPVWARPAFEELPQHRLVGIRAHTPLSRSLLDIADKSDCASLREFIHSMSSLPTIKRTTLEF